MSCFQLLQHDRAVMTPHTDWTPSPPQHTSLTEPPNFYSYSSHFVRSAWSLRCLFSLKSDLNDVRLQLFGNNGPNTSTDFTSFLLSPNLICYQLKVPDLARKTCNQVEKSPRSSRWPPAAHIKHIYLYIFTFLAKMICYFKSFSACSAERSRRLRYNFPGLALAFPEHSFHFPYIFHHWKKCSDPFQCVWEAPLSLKVKAETATVCVSISSVITVTMGRKLWEWR